MTGRVAVHALRNFGADLLCRLGVPPEHASMAADALSYADARGLGTHGTGALGSIYGPRLLDGRVDPAARPETVVDQSAVAVLDAHRGLGLVAMTYAIDLAVRLSRRYGIGAVAIRNSSHFGAAGYYAHRAAEAGCIGLALTNCGTQGVVPPLGGSTRLLGTNPIGAAVPSGKEAPFVLDMSTTAVATGKLAAARRAGAPVPRGWLAGPGDADVEDAEAYYDGRADVRWLGGTLATGAAKGYGLGLLVDLLCGPLAGAGWGPRREALEGAAPADDDDVGHLAIALDPAAFGPPEAFAPRADELLASVRACPPVPDGPPVTYPGAPEAQRVIETGAHGVTVPDHLVGPLLELADHVGASAPAGLARNATANVGVTR